MPRRRKLVRHRSKAIKNAVETEFLIQRLETRRLFTTFSAGVGQTSTYEYEAEGGGVMRIAYHDVTFEALGVSVDSTTDAVAVGDLIPAGIAPPAAPLVAFNLFTIYVTQSAADSFITVAPVARLTANPPPGIRADIPFGAGQALLVNPADGLNLQYAVTPGAGIGGGVLGAYTFAVKGVAPADVPITEVPDPGAHGVYPGNAFGDGLLHAGFIVPDNLTTGLPQNFDAFKFAGEVFGNVHVTGNIQLFYAGALLTGDATGVGIPVNPTSASTAPNFEIDGDLHDLITAGDIGGDLGNGPGAGDFQTTTPALPDTLAGQLEKCTN